MKKIKLIICAFLAMLFLVPSVFAASTTISGNKTVTAGKTTKIYIRLNTNDKIAGADVTYSVSGNISVTNVAVGNGFSKMGQSGNRYILYAASPVNSGSNVLILTVKGTKEGTGTVSVSKMEATVNGQTVSGGTATYSINVTKPVEVKKEDPQPSKEDLEKEAANKVALEKATVLVEAAERSEDKSDYTAAKNAVDALVASTEKDALASRLAKVEFNIAVKDACVCNCEESTTITKCDEKEDKSKVWIIVNIILLVGLVVETIVLISKLNSKKNK